MIKINYRRTLYYLLVIISTINLAACYYHPDLRGQTIGSGAGAVAGGVVATALTSDLITLGGSIIATSIVTGAIGSEFDRRSPLRLDDPIQDPVLLSYYVALRAPLIPQCFYPGGIITENTTLEEIAAIRPPCTIKATHG